MGQVLNWCVGSYPTLTRHLREALTFCSYLLLLTHPAPLGFHLTMAPSLVTSHSLSCRPTICCSSQPYLSLTQYYRAFLYTCCHNNISKQPDHVNCDLKLFSRLSRSYSACHSSNKYWGEGTYHMPKHSYRHKDTT